jgi:hypothetical protein
VDQPPFFANESFRGLSINNHPKSFRQGGFIDKPFFANEGRHLFLRADIFFREPTAFFCERIFPSFFQGRLIDKPLVMYKKDQSCKSVPDPGIMESLPLELVPFISSHLDLQSLFEWYKSNSHQKNKLEHVFSEMRKEPIKDIIQGLRKMIAPPVFPKEDSLRTPFAHLRTLLMEKCGLYNQVTTVHIIIWLSSRHDYRRTMGKNNETGIMYIDLNRLADSRFFYSSIAINVDVPVNVTIYQC